MIRIIKTLLPFFILFALLFLFYREIYQPKQNNITTHLIGETIPPFHLQSLLADNEFFNSDDLKGQVSILNVWASWCYACRVEHPMLMQISERYHVPIYSVNYRDDPRDAKQWLNSEGNPYKKTGIDFNGAVAIDLGIYGTPETFIVNANGEIVYKHIGVIDQKTWEKTLYPLIQQYQALSLHA